jgi:hypothetical protein
MASQLSSSDIHGLLKVLTPSKIISQWSSRQANSQRTLNISQRSQWMLNNFSIISSISQWSLSERRNGCEIIEESLSIQWKTRISQTFTGFRRSLRGKAYFVSFNGHPKISVCVKGCKSLTHYNCSSFAISSARCLLVLGYPLSSLLDHIVCYTWCYRSCCWVHLLLSSYHMGVCQLLWFRL